MFCKLSKKIVIINKSNNHLSKEQDLSILETTINEKKLRIHLNRFSRNFYYDDDYYDYHENKSIWGKWGK